MKKLYALLSATLLCSASYAQLSTIKDKGVQMLNQNSTLLEKNNVGHITYKAQQQSLADSSSEGYTIDPSAFDPTSLISDTPAGEMCLYYKNGNYTTVFYGYVLNRVNTDAASIFVKGDDGCLYLQDPLSGLQEGNYLKFEKESDDTYVAHLPQAIHYQEANGDYKELTAYAVAKEYYTYMEDTTEHWSMRDVEDQDFRIRLTDDSIKFITPNVRLALGAEDGTWYGYMDWDCTFREFDDKLVDVPEGVSSNAIDMVLKYSDLYLADDDGNYYSKDGYKVKCAINTETGKVYAKGVFQEMPSAWIEGDFDGSKASFKSGQYLGIYVDDDGMNYAYFVGANGGLYEDLTYADSISFDVDLTTGKMTTSQQLLLNHAKDYVNYINYVYEPELSYYVPATAAPSDPVYMAYAEFDEDYGYGIIEFYVPIFDVEGNLMDANSIYYNFYTDDNKMTLTKEYYYELSADEMTDIPYTYSDDYDLYAYGCTRTLYFHLGGFTKMGMQLVNPVGDDLKGSHIVYINGDTYEVTYEDGGVNSIQAASAASDTSIASVRYTNMAGQSVNQPAKGIYIKTITMSDGTVKSTKIIK